MLLSQFFLNGCLMSIQNESIAANKKFNQNEIHTIYIVPKNPNSLELIRILTSCKINTQEMSDLINNRLKSLNHSKEHIWLVGDNIFYTIDENKCIIQKSNGNSYNLGLGRIDINTQYEPSNEKISFDIQLNHLSQ